MWTYIKGKLGRCQCKGCFRKSDYIFKINEKTTRDVCKKHKEEIVKILKE